MIFLYLIKLFISLSKLKTLFYLITFYFFYFILFISLTELQNIHEKYPLKQHRYKFKEEKIPIQSRSLEQRITIATTCLHCIPKIALQIYSTNLEIITIKIVVRKSSIILSNPIILKSYNIQTCWALVCHEPISVSINIFTLLALSLSSTLLALTLWSSELRHWLFIAGMWP